MYKTIKVDETTHKELKIGAAQRLVSIKDFLADLANKNTEPIALNVEKYDVDTLEAIRDDIEDELEKRKYAQD